uniref:UBC core domain-containing protein n=1 Tax=Ciona savignyi TaxID=51511 RepID=H2Z8E4_CIOSA
MSNHMPLPMAGSAKALAKELMNLQEEPVEGFKITLVEENNLYDWQVAIFGPPGTLYQGGYFKAHIRFPGDYPYSPPSFRFLSHIWHPNVYENGEVCISILHAPIDDPQAGELPQERWNPTQNVRTILMSVISLLNEPNTFSPANVDASIMFRDWRERKSTKYEDYVKQQVSDSQREADRDGVVVPTTVEEYCVKTTVAQESESSLNVEEFYDEDIDICGDDDEDMQDVESD